MGSSVLFTVVIDEPEKTKAGKLAMHRKYVVQSMYGAQSLQSFCTKHGLVYQSMLHRLKKLPAGRHEQPFMEIVNSMKLNKAAGRYDRTGKKLACPHCHARFTREESKYEQRRQKRDASPVGSVLRAMPASYFGEEESNVSDREAQGSGEGASV